MKKDKSLALLPLIIVAGLLSCGKNSGETTASIVRKGTWAITKYEEHGTDKTNHFADYDFSFDENGTVLAKKKSVLISGTWNSGTSNNEDKFFLDFAGAIPFDELNDDWRIIEKTSILLRLQELVSGNGGIHYLTFEKN